MAFNVEVFEGGAWVPCVREDLLDEHGGDTTKLPPATFEWRSEANLFIQTLRGLMHCGGGDTPFRVVGEPVDINAREFLSFLNPEWVRLPRPIGEPDEDSEVGDSWSRLLGTLRIGGVDFHAEFIEVVIEDGEQQPVLAGSSTNWDALCAAEDGRAVPDRRHPGALLRGAHHPFTE